MAQTRFKILTKERPSNSVIAEYQCVGCGEVLPLSSDCQNLMSECCGMPLVAYKPDWDETLGTPQQMATTHQAITMVKVVAYTIPFSIVLIAAWLIWLR